MAANDFYDAELEKWIHKDEKFMPNRYFAEKGSKVPTIGYGFRLEPGNRQVAERALGRTMAGQLYTNPKFALTEPHAQKLTSEYLRSVTIPAVESYLGRPYTKIPKPIYRSVANLAYNLGPQGLNKFKQLGNDLRQYLALSVQKSPQRFNALARAGQEVVYSKAYNNTQYPGLAARYAAIRQRLLSAEPAVAGKAPALPAPAADWKNKYMQWVAQSRPITWAASKTL